MEKVKRLLKLFFLFLKIGLFTFGGGYAMIALLENEFVSRRGYIEKGEFIDVVTIAESTPGPIAINAATYIGYKRDGFLGALVSTLGVTIPSFVIIYAISLCLDAFLTLRIVNCAFRGVQVGVVYLIFSAGIKMLANIKKTAFNITVFSLVFIFTILGSLFAVSFSSILYIVICGALGVLLYLIKRAKGKGAEK